MTVSTLKQPHRYGKQKAASAMITDFVVDAVVDDATRAQAVRAVVDTLAVTIAGGREPGVAALEMSLDPVDASRGVRSFWTGSAYRKDDAALLFGMASHVLDYDDVSMVAVCHPSSPVLSALLAGIDRPVSGRELLDALAVGTEVLIRLGEVMGFRHYALGFHATATLGAIGAAAALARIAGLDARRTANAVSIAASMSSGLRKNFGSMVKSLHVGIAAANATRAVHFAKAGLEGAEEPLEDEGFFHAFSGGEMDAWPADIVLGSPFVLAEPGFEQKRYPCCYMLHKMIRATLDLRSEHDLSLADVRKMRVDMAIGGTKPLIHPFPQSGLNALFSAPYAVSAALEDGRIDLQSFTDEAVMRTEIQSRLRDVTVTESEVRAAGAKDIGSAPVTVTLSLASGLEVTKTVIVSPGSLQDPLTDQDQREKWLDCLRRARPDAPSKDALALADEGFGIDAVDDVRPWLDRLREVVTP